jgi:hypothetical protein
LQTPSQHGVFGGSVGGGFGPFWWHVVPFGTVFGKQPLPGCPESMPDDPPDHEHASVGHPSSTVNLPAIVCRSKRAQVASQTEISSEALNHHPSADEPLPQLLEEPAAQTVPQPGVSTRLILPAS